MNRKDDRAGSEEPYVEHALHGRAGPKASHHGNSQLKAVLICLDTNVHSERAFFYYIEHFYRADHMVVLVHSAEHPKASLGKSSRRFIEHLKQVQREMVEQEALKRGEPGAGSEEEISKKESDLWTLEDFYINVLEKRKIQYRSRFVWHNGKAGQAIVHMADEEKAILIVTGSRGLGKIRRTLLGSTTDYIMSHTNVPVLVCPKKHEDVPS